MNENNLKPVRSKSEARERGRAGGKASGEKRREQIKLREAILDILSQPMRDENGHFTGQTAQEAIIAALIERACAGDPRAFELIRDTIGEKPSQAVTVNTANFDALDAAFDAMQTVADEESPAVYAKH